MTWLEMRSNPKKVYKLLVDSLKDKYQYKEGSDGVQFKTKNGVPFNVFVMGNEAPWDFLVIEYEDIGEDGDAYYPSDYDTFEMMLEAMIKEIDG